MSQIRPKQFNQRNKSYHAKGICIYWDNILTCLLTILYQTYAQSVLLQILGDWGGGGVHLFPRFYLSLRAAVPPHPTPAPSLLSLSQILSLQTTGKLPLDNLTPNTIFKEGSECFIQLLTLLSLKSSEFSFRTSQTEKSRNYSPSMCAIIIYLVQLKNASLRFSTCHKLAKKSPSKQVGLQAQIPLLWTRVDF